MRGVMTKLVPTTRSVLPSGVARATASVPMTSPAPGRLSTTTDAPCIAFICVASSRARISATAPGGAGTTILIVPVACDEPPGTTKRRQRAATAVARRTSCRVESFMAFPPLSPPRAHGWTLDIGTMISAHPARVVLGTDYTRHRCAKKRGVNLFGPSIDKAARESRRSQSGIGRRVARFCRTAPGVLSDGQCQHCMAHRWPTDASQGASERATHDNAMSEARYNALANSRALCHRACRRGMDWITLSWGGGGGCVIRRKTHHHDYWIRRRRRDRSLWPHARAIPGAEFARTAEPDRPQSTGRGRRGRAQ